MRKILTFTTALLFISSCSSADIQIEESVPLTTEQQVVAESVASTDTTVNTLSETLPENSDIVSEAVDISTRETCSVENQTDIVYTVTNTGNEILRVRPILQLTYNGEIVEFSGKTINFLAPGRQSVSRISAPQVADTCEVIAIELSDTDNRNPSDVSLVNCEVSPSAENELEAVLGNSEISENGVAYDVRYAVLNEKGQQIELLPSEVDVPSGEAVQVVSKTNIPWVDGMGCEILSVQQF